MRAVFGPFLSLLIENDKNEKFMKRKMKYGFCVMTATGIQSVILPTIG